MLDYVFISPVLHNIFKIMKGIKMKVFPQQFALTLQYQDMYDQNGIIGYDQNLKSWYLSGFPCVDDKGNEMLLRLGNEPYAFPSLSFLLRQAFNGGLYIYPSNKALFTMMQMSELIFRDISFDEI